ncbi:MAG: hypothetical protein ACI8UX_000519, partial [Psychromonas sp.]
SIHIESMPPLTAKRIRDFSGIPIDSLRYVKKAFSRIIKCQVATKIS